MPGYLEDLAFIHDDGFTDYAQRAAPGLLEILRRNRLNGGLVVDLGCGSGRWARELNRAGYDALGVDQSPAMIRLARKIAPRSKFVAASLLSARLPECDAVTSIGECINYTFDRRNSRAKLRELFARVYRALWPGGVFVCDFAEPERAAKAAGRHFVEGRDWAVLVEVDGDRERKRLERRIVAFRKSGTQFRRSEETHVLNLYAAEDLLRDLARCGFHARKLRGYGKFKFPQGIAGILAIKPSSRKSLGIRVTA
ncbi:MAG TPA: methyltransferase domain-containing protein [Bryobacteraceae bacterium]|nr:methyltransferase domain-containing protein [Bryobacteraceae bacterium]